MSQAARKKKRYNRKYRRLHKSDRSFIEKTLGTGEKLILIARIHWIALFIGFLWFAGLTLLGEGIEQITWQYLESRIPETERTIMGYQFGSRGVVLQWFLMILGAMIFISYWIGYETTKIALTDKRVLIRKGLIFVRVQEVDLEEIKSERVDHGLLGRFLDYGTLHYDARFVGDIMLPILARPYRLLRKTHDARTRLAESVPFLDTMSEKVLKYASSQPPEEPVKETPIKETDEYVVYKKA